MKRFILIVLLGLVARGALAQESLEVAAKAWLVQDYYSGAILAQQNADVPLEPASLTKMMTAYVVFEALQQGKLKLGNQPPYSESAAKTSGERLPISPTQAATVEQLLQGMLTLSANDAALLLAEATAGSQEAFVEQMNKTARRLGMKNTQFLNPNGLPQKGHVSTARDMAILSVALIRDFPAYYGIFRHKTFNWLGRERAGQNLLLWRDASVDGLKTGTAGSSYSLAASAMRGQRRVIAVVLGASSNEARAIEAQKLLNFGFLNFDTPQVYKVGQIINKQQVWQGLATEVAVQVPQTVYLTVPKGSASKIQAKLLVRQHLIAPLRKGQNLGRVNLSLDGKTLLEIPVVAAETVESSGWWGSTLDRIRWWWKQ